MKKWILGASLSLKFASASDLLSFSSLSVNGNKHLIQILSIDKEEVTYIDLTEKLNVKNSNPFELFKGSNFEKLQNDLNKLSSYKQITKYSSLNNPLTFQRQHLCAGLNYKDHVQESGQKEELVLFPKYGDVVGHNSRVLQSSNKFLPELLDYEIELGLVFNKDIKTQEDIDTAIAAFMVTNDFSDRAPQIYYFGKEGKPSSYSFAAAKSKKGYTLVSPLVVIPKDWKAYAKDLKMELYVNGELRQKASTSMMSKPVEEMLQMALKQNTQDRWPLLNSDETALDEEKPIKLLPEDSDTKAYLAAGMLFMTGTPGGTIFQKPKPLTLFGAALKAPFIKTPIKSKSFKDRVKYALIQKLSNSGKYLQSGDVIESKIDSLGFLNFTISEKL